MTDGNVGLPGIHSRSWRERDKEITERGEGEEKERRKEGERERGGGKEGWKEREKGRACMKIFLRLNHKGKKLDSIKPIKTKSPVTPNNFYHTFLKVSFNSP